MSVIIISGYQHSVYSWIARLAMREKGIEFQWSEIDPFARPKSASYLCLNPFYRVPTLSHNGFIVYETGAITRYIDEQFSGPNLQPVEPQLRAIQNQLISLMDNYGYWPFVRQVFSHQVFRPRIGESFDQTEVQKGLKHAKLVLKAIVDITPNTRFLTGKEIGLADIHLYPLIAYFAAAPQGIKHLTEYPRLLDWFELMAKRPAVTETRPKIVS